MATKERQKRSVRKARAQERAQREAAQAASTSHMSEKELKAEAKAQKKAEAKQAQARKSREADRKPKGKILSYFSGVRSEMHRVVWPSRSELLSYAIAVIFLLIFFGLIIWLVDTGIVAGLVQFTGLRG